MQRRFNVHARTHAHKHTHVHTRERANACALCYSRAQALAKMRRLDASVIYAAKPPDVSWAAAETAALGARARTRTGSLTWARTHTHARTQARANIAAHEHKPTHARARDTQVYHARRHTYAGLRSRLSTV